MDAKTQEISQKIIRVTHFLQIAERHMSQLYQLDKTDAVENHLELLGKLTDIYETKLSALISGTRRFPSQPSS